jgi:hypothetical protein
MTGSPSSSEPGCGDGFYTARDARNQRLFTLWMLAAGITYLGTAAALRWRTALPGALSWLPWLLIGLAWLLAFQAIRRYVIFLRRADELLRRIQTEALALGFGAGAVVSLLYPLLELLGAPKLGEYAVAVAMMLVWSAGTWLGTRHYSGKSSGKSTEHDDESRDA